MKFFNISSSLETSLKSMFAYAGMLTLIGFVGSQVAGGAGVIVALAATSAMTTLTFWFCRDLVLWSMRARELSPNEKVLGFDLTKIISDLTKHSEINMETMPLVCIIDTMEKNAFATGRSKNHAAVAITKGLLQEAIDKSNGDMKQAKRWVKAIFCHELGHVVNNDMASKSVLVLMANAVSIFCEQIYISRRNKASAERKNESGWQVFAEWLAYYVIIPLTSNLLTLCLSRAREYAADDMAKKCGRGEDLAAALQVLLSTPSIEEDSDNHFSGFGSMLCCSRAPDQDSDNAKKLQQKNIGWKEWFVVKSSEIFSTHPPIEQRAQRLLRPD